ncbi:hypothetical protein [Brevibacillus brevis]|uniref:hypothetical protein n=1 Tax=Brevibacillus brevis TaxID=1393 RepID=UPI0007D8B201|nr:hypothetical protein [Brevibacillus brevis]
MNMNYEQNEFIVENYRKFLNDRLKLDTFNAKLQYYFKTTLDFKQIITECKNNNKGCNDIGKFLLGGLK